MATLQLKNVAKRFPGGNWGVRNINIDVRDREFVVLLGPSGCGKTTVLRLIAGLAEVTAGSVFIDGRDVTYLPPRKRDVSMVFQNYAVWPHMTVFENIAFPLRLKKMQAARAREVVLDVARLTRIEENLQRYPDQLSGGQQQRVALARALAVKPKLFLMDEPFSNLDATLRIAMRTELKAIHQGAEATSVFVTHDQAEAMSMADRIIIMKTGEIVQEGTPDDVYFRCADIFVAGFIGTPPMNFFQVNVGRRERQTVLEHPSFSLSLAVSALPASLPGVKGNAILGVRPEDILLVDERQASFSVNALVVEPQGSHQVISVKLDGQIVKIVRAPVPKVRPGDVVHLVFKQDRLHFFDAETTRRIE